ncbi:glutathione S-transferase psoE [Aspergillus foveolatus]|uniref:glutathione S-transferase psoE n=1 Tax=Aspergillus foveolatus TaxID=210207 RepID=UPI003CCCC6B5
MTFGTLYTFPGDHCRTIAIKAVAKANGLELDIRETPRTPDHLSISKLGKVPAFQGADGFNLFECMAIALLITAQNEQATLLGHDKKECADIIKLMSLFNSEIFVLMTQQLLPQLGVIPYDRDQVELFANMTQRSVDVVEEHLQDRTFDRLSLADLFCAGNISLGFQFFYGNAWRRQNPNVSRWYGMVCHRPICAAVTQRFQLVDEPDLTNNPPENTPETQQPKLAAAVEITQN